MRNKSGKLYRLAQSQTRRVDQARYSFWENLLTCKSTTLVGKDMGTEFRISRDEDDGDISLLFRVDDRHDPLIVEESKRPDYLCLNIRDGVWVFTIIDLKSDSATEIKKGIKQIAQFRDFLVDRIGLDFPGCQCVIQGLIVCRENAQIPAAEVRDARKTVNIHVVQSSQRAELMPYVRNANTGANVVVRPTSSPRRPRPDNNVEILLRSRALHEPKYPHSSRNLPLDRRALCVRYGINERDETITLLDTSGRACIEFHECDDQSRALIEHDLRNAGIHGSIVLRP